MVRFLDIFGLMFRGALVPVIVRLITSAFRDSERRP